MGVITRKYLFELIQAQNFSTLVEKLEAYEIYLVSHYGETEDDKKSLKHKFSYIKSQIKQRWTKAHKIEEAFLKQNESWLAGTFESQLQSHKRQGRPSKSFEDLSQRSKLRKSAVVRATMNDEIIVHAAQSVLQKSGKRDASKVLRDISNSPTRASAYRKAYSKADETISPLTPFQALKMFVEADLTRRQYEIIRETNKKHFPCYDLLISAKKECYPKESLCVTATCAESNFQCLMDLTVNRLSLYLEDVLKSLNTIEKKSLTIICKWGCDGSQQDKFKQRFDNDSDCDGSLFVSSFVPLQIVCGTKSDKIVWQNPTPSSPRFCRPIRFRYIKESTDITKDEINYVENAVKSLNPSNVTLQEEEFTFKYIFKMTMIDGKVCNAATNTLSTSRCYICGATSKNFNNLDMKTVLCPQALDFGLSVLHARIRIFESILHLAYKLPVKKYRERKTHEEKQLEEKKKKEIQKQFRIRTGLLVDMPKAQVGNTNDGNTSRRFFENPELAAEITGIDFTLIFRLKVILEAISSGHRINTEKYDEYAIETAKLYINMYGWHPMSPTMHKVLIHGASIIHTSILPIGQLSEEAAEARNKHFRSYRQNYARKFSREECNLDIYQRLLLTSDPLISCSREIKKKSRKSFLPETIELLMSGSPNPMSEQEEGLEYYTSM